MLNAGAHVIVFEPFLDAFTALLYNTRNRGVQAHNTAVGNGEWVKFVYECPGPNYGMRRVKACDPADPEAFPTYRLESLMRMDDKWKVKLIKIDCEGFEIPTLRGAAESSGATSRSSISSTTSTGSPRPGSPRRTWWPRSRATGTTCRCGARPRGGIGCAGRDEGHILEGDYPLTTRKP